MRQNLQHPKLLELTKPLQCSVLTYPRVEHVFFVKEWTFAMGNPDNRQKIVLQSIFPATSKQNSFVSNGPYESGKLLICAAAQTKCEYDHMYPKSAFERLKDHTQRVWKSLSHCIISHPLHQRLSFEQTAVPISNARNFMASVICSTLKKGVG